MVRHLNWATYVVGLSIVAVELAVLLAYRAGWRISLASAVANVTTALLLVLIGVVWYQEHLALRHVLGLAMCLLGLVLVAGS
jgi:multidrug transporter EmrE-like cation transporter